MRTLPGLALLFLAASVAAQEVKPAPAEDPAHAPTFLGVYAWKQALWQYVPDAEGTYRSSRGDPWGGRVVGGLGLGRWGVDLRLDVSGLKDEFSLEDPETFQTFETYGAAYYVAAVQEGFQIGPIGVVGTINTEVSQGVEVNMYAAGVRLGGYGSEFHLLVGKHDYLIGEEWRFSLSGHIPIAGTVYAVGDLVSGKGGFARLGIAVRIK